MGSKPAEAVTKEAKGAAGQFQFIELTQLVESKHNPRRNFAKDALQDLANSIREKGVLTPLLVRTIVEAAVPYDRRYEILAGARRFRAAKAARLTEAPCVIRNLSDIDAYEVQVIENLQREDLHPLEEAEGYKQLLATGKYDVDTLAAKVGKSTSYVYARLKLADLSPKLKKAFEEEEITAGHAILLARLQHKDQEELLKEGDCDGSVRDLAEQIRRAYHLELAKAVFPTDSKELLPMAGSCVECPKRTGANPNLFADIKEKDLCTDGKCFAEKETAFVKLQVGTHPAAVLLSLGHRYNEQPKGCAPHEWKPAGKQRCKDTGEGVIIQWQGQPETYDDKKGLKLGQVLDVCINPTKCPVHREREETVDRSAQRKQLALLAARTQAFQQIVEKAKAYEPVRVVQVLTDRTDFEASKLACKALGIWPKNGKTGGFDFAGKLCAHAKAIKPGQALNRLFAALCLAPGYGKWSSGYYGRANELANLYAAGRAAKVNVKALERKFVAEANAKAKKRVKAAKAKGQTSAKKA